MAEQQPKLAPTPLKCISIILCEKVYPIPGPQNFVLVNTFHSVPVSQVPCDFGPITVFYTVTEGHGTYDITLSVVNARTGQEMKRWDDRYVVTNPLSVGDVQMILRNVPFPEAGKYWIELRCNGELIGTRPFYVDLVKKKVTA